MYLDGDGIRHRGPRGERLTDESYLLVLHAGAEDAHVRAARAAVGERLGGRRRHRVPGRAAAAAASRPAAGLDLPLTGRSAVLLRAVRTPVVGAPPLVTAPPGPGTG